MPIIRSRATKFQRNLRYILSSFFHLIMEPGERRIFTWKEMIVPICILIFVIFALIVASTPQHISTFLAILCLQLRVLSSFLNKIIIMLFISAMWLW